MTNQNQIQTPRKATVKDLRYVTFGEHVDILNYNQKGTKPYHQLLEQTPEVPQ
jgi:hypothetical protein